MVSLNVKLTKLTAFIRMDFVVTILILRSLVIEFILHIDMASCKASKGRLRVLHRYRLPQQNLILSNVLFLVPHLVLSVLGRKKNSTELIIYLCTQ